MPSIQQFLAENSLVIFPGAVGTELQRRGYATKLPLWSAGANMEAPELVRAIHDDYFAAGADIAVTNSFRTTPRTYQKTGNERAAFDALARSVDLALQAKSKVKDRPVFVGGSFAPLEDCYRPDLAPGDEALAHEHGMLAERLAAAGVDFLLPETMNSGREALAMVKAAAAAQLPFIASFVVEENGTLLDGTPLSAIVPATDLPGRLAVSLNCRPINTLNAAFDILRASYHGVIGLYPNGFGHAHDDLGWCFTENSDDAAAFARISLDWQRRGAKIIGGCCGTTPAYIRALAAARVAA